MVFATEQSYVHCRLSLIHSCTASAEDKTLNVFGYHLDSRLQGSTPEMPALGVGRSECMSAKTTKPQATIGA